MTELEIYFALESFFPCSALSQIFGLKYNTFHALITKVLLETGVNDYLKVWWKCRSKFTQCESKSQTSHLSLEV